MLDRQLALIALYSMKRRFEAAATICRVLEGGKQLGIHKGYITSRYLPGIHRRSENRPRFFAPTWGDR